MSLPPSSTKILSQTEASFPLHAQCSLYEPSLNSYHDVWILFRFFCLFFIGLNSFQIQLDGIHQSILSTNWVFSPWHSNDHKYLLNEIEISTMSGSWKMLSKCVLNDWRRNKWIDEHSLGPKEDQSLTNTRGAWARGQIEAHLAGV